MSSPTQTRPPPLILSLNSLPPTNLTIVASDPNSSSTSATTLSAISSVAKSALPISRAGLTRKMTGMNGNLEGAVKEFDYIVIGGGSGGSGAARRAAAPKEKGGWEKNVLLVEDGKSGGCCVNVGYVSPNLQSHDKSALENLEEERVVVEPV